MADTESSTELKQFKLTDEGGIFFQPDPTNPLPGEKIGCVRKGTNLMQPAVEITKNDLVDEPRVKAWLQLYIGTVLEPLKLINDDADIPQAARNITKSLYESLGILPRADLETFIEALDEEGRRALRQRKVRLGPVLVFLPMLSKPASVRLRALLWNLWHDKQIPAEVPADGVTSISVADKDFDPLYLRAIGYPVYGRRAIRVDMLDRLIVAVYDSADKGVFKARHDMAEWLGCPIPDLYEVLEAMDHKKIHDPAEEKIKEEAQTTDEPADVSDKAEDKQDVQTEAPQEKQQEKPELATFRLRRGKAYGRPPVPKTESTKKPVKKSHKPKQAPRKDRPPQKERVISAMAKKNEDDNPFAALKSLKVQGKE